MNKEELLEQLLTEKNGREITIPNPNLNSLAETLKLIEEFEKKSREAVLIAK